MIFNAKNAGDQMQSFSFPFISLNDVQLEQPVFGANYIKGKVRAQVNGNWSGEAKFKLVFKNGGAIDFGQAMLRAASMAQRNGGNGAPPPYTPPGTDWFAAPPPAYTPNPYNYGWVPTGTVFSQQPPPNSIYMHDSPPPYPGIIANQPQNYPAQPPYGGAYPAQQNGYPTQQPGYPVQQHGFAPQQPGYPMQQPGYPPQQAGGFPAQPGYGFVTGPGYSGDQNGAAGFTPNQGPPANSKEAEAAQSAFYDPSRPPTGYAPPPAYYEPPPSYNTLDQNRK
ncbi:WW domain-binding protein 2 isoform X2 [Uranotaenia lowii]|nr:WW domain-binding protein 2 isoform X2 [Uranotaenia lowii]